MNCPTCGLPMVWSQERQRQWCSVYGSHPSPTWHVWENPTDETDLVVRDLSAPGARLVDAIAWGV